MNMVNVIKRFIKKSAFLEKSALQFYELVPLSFKYKISYGYAFPIWAALLKESETWNKDQIYEYQIVQIKKLLMHANKNVPYYKRLFAEMGFRPEKIQDLNDVKVIPYLKKETIRSNSSDFIAFSFPWKALISKSTSGSTGIPLTFYYSQDAKDAFYAFRENLLARICHTQKSREVSLWAMIELGRKKNLPFLKYGNKLVLSIRYLTDKWLPTYLRMMKEFEPEFILGYPTALSIISSFMKNHSSVPFKNLKAVICYAETLYDWQRNIIQDAFDVRVYSMYAMTEIVAVGSECESSNSLHFHPLYGLVEFADIVPGYKEIIATGFTNYAMPLIRYRTNDLVKEYTEFCDKCGRYHKTTPTVLGRTQDFLIGKNNEVIPRLMPYIKNFPNVLQFQFYQEEPGKAYLKIIKSKTFLLNDAQYIKSKIVEMLGPMKDTIDIEIISIDAIETSQTGKINMVDQKLDIKQILKV